VWSPTSTPFRERPVSDIDLPPHMIEMLVSAVHVSASDLIDASDEKLLPVRGLGQGRRDSLRWRLSQGK
jgi:hypothetical protein